MDIKRQSEANKSQTGKVVATKTRHHWVIGTYIIFALGSLVFYFLIIKNYFHLSHYYQDLFSKLTLAALVTFIVLIISRIIERIIGKSTHERSATYNAMKVIRFITIIIILFVFISFLNANWYTAAASLGLISLLLGFALQSPISSLIGWFYIIIRNHYKVGDRIQVSNFTGDVVEIGYFDTTLWEFAGDYMTNDLPSGRLIRFPNALLFQYQVYNYSWHKFPYIWNEIPFHVAYESDLAYIEQVVKEIAKEELGQDMIKNVEQLKGLIEKTPVDEMEIKEYPFVNFRINANTWVEVLLIYLVEPKMSGAIRTRLIKKILERLLKEPDRVMFPKTNAR